MEFKKLTVLLAKSLKKTKDYLMKSNRLMINILTKI